ncbi:spexin isoform X7 [Bubalus bubalis]|uniref:spexin isoform X7 n=1 Tax=Bubalus bubalis TaxID=89462 RepID=UPI00042CC2BA|nr:spexin isoform X7 [Bubalus bubalis]
MKGFKSLVVMTLTLFLVFSFMGNCNSAPQVITSKNWGSSMRWRLFERRNWTPQAMLYLKGAQRRSPNSQQLTLPEAAAVLLAFLQKPQEAGDENLDQTRFLEDSLLNW